MNPFDTRLKNALRESRLTNEERERIRAVLVREMESAAADATDGVSSGRSIRHLGHPAHFSRRHIKRTFMPIAAILIALLLGGSVSYAAEGSLPGDTLYPVKIHVNEEVRGAFAWSDASEAELELTLAERRLLEAAELLREARLDDNVKVELRERFDDHRGRGEERLREIEASDVSEAERIHAKFKITLGEHSDAVKHLEIEYEDDHDEGGDDDRGRGKDDEGDDDRSATSSSRPKNDDADELELEIEIEDEEDEDMDDDQRSSRREDDDEDEDDDDRSGRSQSAGVAGTATSPVAPAPAPAPSPSPSPTTAAKTFTMAEVGTHKDATSCYTVVRGGVYDVTGFITAHPGGAGAIITLCGKDGTTFFEAQHNGDGKPENMLATLRIGTLAQ